jgi:hypothetical protein
MILIFALIVNILVFLFPLIRKAINSVGGIVYRGVLGLFITGSLKTIMCNHCLRYTSPWKADYKSGRRYCEHCHAEVEQTTEPGKVIFTFGSFNEFQLQKLQPANHRVFLKENLTFGYVPLQTESNLFFQSRFDLNQHMYPVDVSEVYIDTATCESWRLERFMTYIVNNPPQHGIRSVKIFYQGELESLGENLKNTLRNNFEHIEKIDDLNSL